MVVDYSKDAIQQFFDDPEEHAKGRCSLSKLSTRLFTWRELWILGGTKRIFEAIPNSTLNEWCEQNINHSWSLVSVWQEAESPYIESAYDIVLYFMDADDAMLFRLSWL